MSKLFLKFTYDECKATILALVEMFEAVEDVARDPRIPWNPEARATQMEILTAARSAAKKLSAITGIPLDLPKYNKGDEDEFLTKES